MQPNRVKKILREGGLALGTYVGGIAEPQIVEIIGHAGFDAAFIDLEHTSFDLRDVQLMVMAAERVGITPIVRTPGFDPAFILRLLDMGVQGIQLPHISDARAAREAVRAVRYAPLGERGMAGASRASDYGMIPIARAHRAVQPRDHAGRHDRGPARARGDRRHRVHRGRRHRRGGAVGHVARAGRERHRRPPEARRGRPSRRGGGAEGRRGAARAADEPRRRSRATPRSSGSSAWATPTARRRPRCACSARCRAQVAEARALLA